MKFGCWVISLNEQDEQTHALFSSLKEQHVDAKLFPAVDGRKGIPSFEGEEYIDEKESLIRHKKLLSSSQVGCYLSHYRAIRQAYDQGYDRICLLEDDVVLEPYFGQVLQKVIDLPGEYEMTRLMALKIRKRKVLEALFEDDVAMPHQLVRPERGWCGTQGYVLSRQGMEKVLNHGKRIFEPIDKLYDHFFEFDLKLYGVEPHIIYEKVSTSSVSQKPKSKPVLSIFDNCLYHLYKGYRSCLRHLYLKKYHDDFYPCNKPEQRPGNTERMK